MGVGACGHTERCPPVRHGARPVRCVCDDRAGGRQRGQHGLPAAKQNLLAERHRMSVRLGLSPRTLEYLCHKHGRVLCDEPVRGSYAHLAIQLDGV